MEFTDALETADTAVTTTDGGTAAGAGSTTTTTGRTAGGAGSTTDGATTALGSAARIDAVAGWAGADAAVTDRRVDSAEAGLALSLSDAAADGLTFFTGAVDDECPEPDDFFSDIVVDTPALASSAPVAWPDADADGVGSVGPATELDGVVPVEADEVVPVEPDGAVPVDPAADPDDDVVFDVDDPSEAVSAHATPVE